MIISRNSILRQLFIIVLASFMVAVALFAQTAPNTVITNQAKALYKFKTFPKDSVISNVVQFSVLDAPNFEMAFSVPDSLVFGKETVQVRITYKNIGNATADSATITGELPAAGLRFLAGSTGGTISGTSVSWKVRNVAAGKTDSVSVKVIVDSTLTVNTQLMMDGTLDWSSSSITASKTLVISSIPKLSLAMTPSADIVGSGRSVSYTLTIANPGNVAAQNTVLYDTLSANGTFLSASVTPDSLSANDRIVKWNLGTIPAFSSRQIVLTVRSSVNLGSGSITNIARTSANNVPAGDRASSVTSIVPVLPKSMTITAEPEYVWGQNKKDSALVTVTVKDSTGTLMPDGTPVKFDATLGTFLNGTSSFTGTTSNGVAAAYLRAADVTNDIVRSTITGTAGTVSLGTISDTTHILLYPGAVTGIVVNGINRMPFQGAIARVYNISRVVVGADTTQSDGKFFIPLMKDVTRYTLEIIVVDKFGDTVRTTTDIDPSRFPLPPIVIPNIISGRIEYKVSGDPIPAENVSVFLDSIGVAPKNVPNRARTIRSLRTSGLARVQETMTDKGGKFKFENLRPAKYVVSVDSAEFPNFTGYTFLSDTATGTFTINLSLQIVLDSSVTLGVAAPASVNAGDTITVGIGLTNSGNTEHHAVQLTDTLSSAVKFVNASLGSFTAVSYDSAHHTVRWNRDTLKTLTNDSITLRLAVIRNVPDLTPVTHGIWFTSSSLSQKVSKITTIRSSGVLHLSNNFVMSRDTIIAGDSIRHLFRFSNSGTDSIRGLRIVDTLFSAGLSGISLAKSALDSTRIVDSVSVIYIGALAPLKSDSVSLKLITDFSLRTGSKVISHAYAMIKDSVIARRDTMFIVNENPDLANFLKVMKTANKKVAEIGDIVTYQVQVTNSSPQFVRSVGIYDMVPYAFHYVKGSARFNGRAVEPRTNDALHQMIWNLPDTIASTKTGTLVYQLAIGADAEESEGINTAYASAVASGGTPLIALPSQWQITVRPGAFTEKGLIIGKVFYDDNRNFYQNEGEIGVKGVELWMEDGTKITTGDDGKYSVPEVKPGQHVIRVNEATLPENASLIAGGNAFAKDPVSRFVRVTESGIARANFYVKRVKKDSVAQTVAKVNKLIAVRQAKPKYLYVDTLRKISVDTVRMYVSFAYSGNKPLRSITILDRLPEAFTIVPYSGSFRGQRINPFPVPDGYQWRLSGGPAVTNGVLSYSVAVKRMPSARTILPSSSIVTALSVDSIPVETGRITVENVVVDTTKNRIETSETVQAMNDPHVTNHLSDSVAVTAGDEVYFKTVLYIDPFKKIKSVRIIDTLSSAFIINDRSFTVNGVPVPSKDLSIKVRSSSLSSAEPGVREDLEFFRVASLTVSDRLKGGRNEITYTALLQQARKDTVARKRTYAVVTNMFDETSTITSLPTTIAVRAGTMSHSIALETTYVNIPRPSVNVQEKVAEAVKLVESLTSSTAKAVVMDGITFELAKSTLTKDSKVVLDNIAEILKKNPSIRIQINGYTDNTGNAASNRKMSLNRAKEVAAYLTQKGIDASRMMPQGFGPNNPIATNKTEEGRAKNRRVEFAPLR